MTQTLITPYCTVAWADEFYSQYLFSEDWAEASDAKKKSAICAATDFIDLYCKFHETFRKSDEFPQSDPNDYANAVNPRLLKQACAQEACYLLSLDDNPAEPFPITVLGLLKGDFGTVDDSLVPPIFPAQVIRL